MAKEKVTRKKKSSTPSNSLLDAVVFGMQEVKGNDIHVMDMRGLSHAMADYFVVCHGNSNTQVKAIADSVERETFKLCNEHPFHVEGLKNAHWVLMDYVNVVVHIFDKDSRAFYALEDLWADAESKRID